MALACNLDLSCLVYLPTFTVFAILIMFKNSPSANLVKQVDYIVWKTIFFFLNLALVSLAVWWPLIQKEKPDPEAKTQFDFSAVKRIIFDELLPLREDYSDGYGWSFGSQTLATLLCSAPGLYLLAKNLNCHQLVRAVLLIASLTYLFGFKDYPKLAISPLLSFAILLSPEMTPFISAIALMVNLSIRHQTATPLTQWWYLALQTIIVTCGGTYERIVLSDYGFKEQHGRSFWFWTGDALEESAFQKGKTSLSRLIRRWRNLLCSFSLVCVCILDPALSILLPETSKVPALATTICVKFFVLCVPVLFNLSQMYQAMHSSALNT